MKYVIQFTLLILASLCFMLFVLLGIDMSIANRDYEKLIQNGDYEQSVNGCIFDFVCEHYTKELWK